MKTMIALGVFSLAVSAPPAPARSGRVTTSDGVSIRYVDQGRGKGPALLFVPGWTMHAEIWQPQIDHFAKSRRVVAIDPRSQGNSSKPSEGNYPGARARDYKTVVDRLKLAPVVLVGWSMGATELVSYVDQFGNDTLAGLVLVDGIVGGSMDPKMTAAMMQWAASFQNDRRKMTAEFVRSMYRKPQKEEYIQGVIKASLKTPTNSALALFLGTFTLDNRPALAKIKVPMLIVTTAGGPWQGAYEEIRQRVPGATLERMEGVGHALFVDDAPQFNSLLEKFLKPLGN